MILQIARLLLTFGPDVIELIADLVKTIKKNGCCKDRKAAERIMYRKAWAIRNGLTDLPEE
jgi:hypothetical protein